MGRSPGPCGGRLVEPAHILIVDDEPFNLDVLEQELDLLGHTSVRAENGREALERLEDEPFDLVLLDVMMPRLDGYAVLGCMKSHEAWRHIPVIMISALTDQSSVVRCIARGCGGLSAEAFRAGTPRGEDWRLPRKKAATRPGGGASRRDRTRAEASRRASARNLTSAGGGRAQGDRPRAASPFWRSCGPVRRPRRLHGVVPRAPP